MSRDEHRRRFAGKKAPTVQYSAVNGSTATWDQINKYFALMQMPIISSRYWTAVHGAAPDQVLEDKEGMQVMKILGNNMAYFLKCKDLATRAGLMPPEQEPTAFTNFIR